MQFIAGKYGIEPLFLMSKLLLVGGFFKVLA
jgi:hypothetical protein